MANEQVIEGRGWRSDAIVEQRELSQWFLKITDYAEELLHNLEDLSGWPEKVLAMQKNWIGKSLGAEVSFSLKQAGYDPIVVFTTRPDTLFGASFLALSIHHPLVQKACETDEKLVAFIEELQSLGTAEADIATAEKKGYRLPLKLATPLMKA